MRDYTGAFPELEMFETWVTTTATNDPIRRVQAFRKGERIVCPELSCDLYEGGYFFTFEGAKDKLVRDAEQSVKWSQEHLERVRALALPTGSLS